MPTTLPPAPAALSEHRLDLIRRRFRAQLAMLHAEREVANIERELRALDRYDAAMTGAK